MGNRPLSNRLQKDRMMRKASAGVLCFVAILFLLAGPVPMGVAQDADAPPVAAEPVSAETVVAPAATAPASGGLADLAAMRTASAAAETTSEPEPVPAPAPRPTPEERLATLQDADPAALRAAHEDCMQAAQEIAAYVPELHRQVRQAYEDARQNDPAIQDLNRQIAELEARREQLLVNHPAVLEKRRAIDQAQQDMLAELRLRTTLEGRIAAQSDGMPVPAPEAPAE